MKATPAARLRRHATVVVAFVASLALATGCVGGGGGKSEETSSKGKIPTDTKGTVRVLMEEVPDTDIVKGLVRDFNEQYPNIKVQIQTLTYDQMRDKLVASFQAPKPTYDLVVVDNPWMHDFAKGGFLEPLEGRIENTPGYAYDDFAEPLREINEVGGHTYGVPFYNYALGLIYRKDLFAQKNLTPPKSTAQLAATAKKLDTAKRAGIAMQPQRGYKVFEEWGNFLFSEKGQIYDAKGKPTLDTPQARKALQAYVDMYRSSAPKNSLNWAFDEAQRAVASDKAAMMVSYNWMLPTLNKKGSGKYAGKFGLAPFPGGKQVLGSWSWSVPANSGTSDAAWAFTSWVTSKKGEQQRVIDGGAPVRMSALDDPTVRTKGYGGAYYDTVRTMLQNSAPLSEGANGEEMIQAVGTELNAAVAGKKEPAAALTAAEEQARKIQGE